MRTHFGRFELLRRLGAGATAEVFLARGPNPEDAELIALKIVLPHLADDARLRESLIAEAKLCQRIQHRHVARIYEAGEADGRPYLAMEYVRGWTVSHVLKKLRERRETFSLDEACSMARDAALGLHHAHELLSDSGKSLGLVHRDVSPQNLILGADGRVKVVDFGLAKATQVVGEQTGAMKGKIAYMPPEQINGGKLDRRVDVFALGAVLFELITGERLYPGKSEAEILRQAVILPAPDVAGALSGVAPQVVEAIQRAITRDLQARTPNALVFAHAIKGFIGVDTLGSLAARARAAVGGEGGATDPSAEPLLNDRGQRRGARPEPAASDGGLDDAQDGDPEEDDEATEVEPSPRQRRESIPAFSGRRSTGAERRSIGAEDADDREGLRRGTAELRDRARADAASDRDQAAGEKGGREARPSRSAEDDASGRARRDVRGPGLDRGRPNAHSAAEPDEADECEANEHEVVEHEVDQREVDQREADDRGGRPRRRNEDGSRRESERGSRPEARERDADVRDARGRERDARRRERDARGRARTEDPDPPSTSNGPRRRGSLEAPRPLESLPRGLARGGNAAATASAGRNGSSGADAELRWGDATAARVLLARPARNVLKRVGTALLAVALTLVLAGLAFYAFTRARPATLLTAPAPARPDEPDVDTHRVPGAMQPLSPKKERPGGKGARGHSKVIEIVPPDEPASKGSAAGSPEPARAPRFPPGRVKRPDAGPAARHRASTPG